MTEFKLEDVRVEGSRKLAGDWKARHRLIHEPTGLLIEFVCGAESLAEEQAKALEKLKGMVASPWQYGGPQ